MEGRRSLRCSLTALRTFEAVARAGSLSAAAEELSVSVAAVSFQLKELQERLGTALLQRTARGLQLTAEGRLLAADLAHAFAAIDRALDAFQARRRESAVVTISTVPVFASRWLLPWLARFQSRHPGIEVRVTTTERLLDLEREGVHLAVRVGPGPWQGLNAHALFPQQIAPVCRRRLAERFAEAIAQRRIGELPLIGHSARPGLWEYWARSCGVAHHDLHPTQLFDSSEMAFQAVLEGLGAGLIDTALAHQELAHGDLVRIHPAAWASGWTHFLVWPAELPLTPAAGALHAWIVEEAAAEQRSDASAADPPGA